MMYRGKNKKLKLRDPSWFHSIHQIVCKQTNISATFYFPHEYTFNYVYETELSFQNLVNNIAVEICRRHPQIKQRKDLTPLRTLQFHCYVTS